MFILNGIEYMNTRDVINASPIFDLTQGNVLRAAKRGYIKGAIFYNEGGRGQWLYPEIGAYNFIQKLNDDVLYELNHKGTKARKQTKKFFDNTNLTTLLNERVKTNPRVVSDGYEKLK